MALVIRHRWSFNPYSDQNSDSPTSFSHNGLNPLRGNVLTWPWVTPGSALQVLSRYQTQIFQEFAMVTMENWLLLKDLGAAKSR